LREDSVSRVQPIPPQENPLADLGFRLIPPGNRLRPYVRSYWTFRRASPLLIPREEYMHPGGGFGIAFNLGTNLSLDAQPLTELVFLDGATTVSRKMSFSGTVDMIGISFYAGEAFPFLGIPLAELINETALLDILDRPALLALHGRLYEAKTLPARIRLLESWLIQRLKLGNERSPLIPESLSALRTAPDRQSIATLAASLSVSQRQLERLYQVQVGMTPKQYSTLHRVETARLALKQINRKSTTDLAVDLGFYDQSHFIREFSAVVGMTPYAYMQRSLKRSQTSSEDESWGIK
jgi:AraC-like DNA-binding protein